MTIKWLLQLTMALECETFVGTRGVSKYLMDWFPKHDAYLVPTQSGWNRLIDQLRCTWYSNCRTPYIEVGDDESWVRSLNIHPRYRLLKLTEWDFRLVMAIERGGSITAGGTFEHSGTSYI